MLAIDKHSSLFGLFLSHERNKIVIDVKLFFFRSWQREEISHYAWPLKVRKDWDKPGNTKRGKYHCTVDLLFDWFGISCTTFDNCWFYLQNRLIKTSQTGGQLYSDTSPFSQLYSDTSPFSQLYSDTSPFCVPCINSPAFSPYTELRRSKTFLQYWHHEDDNALVGVLRRNLGVGGHVWNKIGRSISWPWTLRLIS